MKATDTNSKAGPLSAEAKRARLRRAKAGLPTRPDRCLHQSFEAQAGRRPEAVAVVCEGRRLTYGELNAEANRLAHHLRTLGVGPGVLVGLCVERSPEMLIGLLGILKAGGAYVPLDVTYPAERLAFLLADSGVSVLLTQQSLRDALPRHSARAICLDADRNLFADQGDENPLNTTKPHDAAYVIYTSGSTGKPKGVLVSHANVVRLFGATQSWFHFHHRDVWTLFHSFAFDFSVWEIWGALLYGGRLVVVPYWVSRTPESFYELLRAQRVTVLNQTPSAFRQLIRAEEALDAPDELSLRLVIFGGEALELQSLRPWFERHGDRTPQLVNMYGITETTVHVTYRPVAIDDLAEASGSSPIGRPIPDLRLYLLDRNLQPVPVGVAGEIHVGGEGLARGYLNRPGLTSERFIPDPFSGTPGARLYKSGDLARFRPDGDIEYLGRADHQVKIRGFRIELGEIEAALAQQDEIREAVVLAREDTPGDTRLVAYVVARSEGVPSAADLRRRLKRRLPDYMVPWAFVTMEALPLTPHGKVDFRALPAPEMVRAALDGEYLPPRTPTEDVLAGIWAEVLGVERVGVLDDFFALGGHSLLATQVASRLREAFAVSLPLRSLFEFPTVAGLAERVDADRQGDRQEGAPAIGRVPRHVELPLSFAQQALWFLDRLAPGQPTFNVTAAVRIRGPLDLAALECSLAEIIRRHEALRTTFTTVDGRPVQVIAPAFTLPLTPVDLSDLPEPDREARAEQLAAEEARRPFDLSRGPLVRALVLRLAEREHGVLLTMHHIVSDGWSMGVAARELAALYEAFAAGAPSPLPEPAIQYADYADWQRRWLQGDAVEGLLAYWTRQLAGLRPLDLPTDRPRPAVQTSRGATRFFALSPSLSEALRALGRREGATPFMTLLAAFQALLHRYSGMDDVAVGSPIANRNRAETEELIGYFVNMLVLRTDLSGDPTFRELLGRVREVALGAYEHQDLPFDRLVEAIQPRRDLSRTPLFQVMFVLQNNPMPDVGRQDLTLDALPIGEGTGTAKFDLTLGMVETPDGLAGSLEYNTDLFDPATIGRMLDHFQALLAAVVAHPELRLSRLPLMDDAERHELLSVRNRTSAEFPRDACVHQLIEAQVERTPEATALVGGGRSLSYRELNARANRLAHFLRKRGIGPDMRVAIAVERSPEMAVGLLGILKAGGTFVPLDPSYPRERLAIMLEDSSAALLLTQEALRGRLPESTSKVIWLDKAGDAIVQTSEGEAPAEPVGAARQEPRPPETSVSDVTSENAAYVIYTSGSTGKPRGAVITHRGMVNHNLAVADLFGLQADDRVLQFSSLSFDIAVEELFPAWIRGATVVLRGDDGVLEPAEFTRFLERERITVLDLPTAYWHAWVNGIVDRGEAPPESLRLVVVGGEKAMPAVHASWRKLVGDRVRWLNTYGPTETTVIATAFEPPTSDRGEVSGLPIGRPIANTSTYVLDAQLEPVPLGLPGELYIGGEGVARGYLDRPGMTAERFVPDPFGDRPGSRLFKTGDRVRWRADGELEFLGRIDHQVKIRGFRVEPGEIEAALLEHPAIREAVVVALDDPAGEGRLAGYVVAQDQVTTPPSALRRFLQERLPRYMVPSTFTTLASLPLTPSGKVDRRALPPPGRVDAERDDGAVMPRDEVESQLARIWEELLNTRPVGVTDNFFERGGHSLLAVRLTARIEDHFGRRLPLSTLFLNGTIEELAAILREPTAARPWSPLVAIQPSGAGAPFFCVHPAGGIVYCFQELARHLGTDRPFFGLQAAGLDGEREPYTRLEEMAARYAEAVREVQPEGPYHLGGWSLGGLVAFEMAQQLRDQGQQVATLAVLDTQAPTLGGTPDAADDATLLAQFAGGVDPGLNGNARRLMEHLRGLGPEGQRDYILKHFGIGDVYHLDELYRSENGPERVDRLLEVLRLNLLAGLRYAPRTYPGHLTLFRAGEGRHGAPDPTMGWSKLALGGVTTHVVPGDHATILKPPGVLALAEVLRSSIAMARPNPEVATP